MLSARLILISLTVTRLKARLRILKARGGFSLSLFYGGKLEINIKRLVM